MSNTKGYVPFETKDFHAHAAHATSKTAGDHASSAMTDDANAYMHHLSAAKAHDDAVRAHHMTAKMLPLPVNASKPDEGTPVATVHTNPPAPILDQKSVARPNYEKRL